MKTRDMVRSLPLLKNFYYAVHFLIRTIRIRLVLVPIDKLSPFEGPFAASGVFRSKMSEAMLDRFRQKIDSIDLYSPVSLDSNDDEIIREIFEFLTPRVRSYLGEECFLDGITWFVTVRDSESISSSWHTDNVGNRLRVFYCIEGDGSQPTYVVSSSDRIPTFSTWIKHSCIELLRWAGGRVRSESFKDTVICDYRDGDIYVFDTQLLHRGGYEGGKSRRVIFSLEFSNPRKHELARGPIGTDQMNSFKFSSALLSCRSFSAVLDPSRVNEDADGMLVYSKEH